MTITEKTAISLLTKIETLTNILNIAQNLAPEIIALNDKIDTFTTKLDELITASNAMELEIRDRENAVRLDLLKLEMRGRVQELVVEHGSMVVAQWLTDMGRDINNPAP